VTGTETAAEDAVRFAHVDWAGHAVRIEYQWIAPDRAARPLVVFLHEGLGSLAMWKSFPSALCSAGDFRGLVFSRPGNGRSTQPASLQRKRVDYLHRQALELLPAFFHAVGVDTAGAPPWLFGHSDGGSIALLYAARFPAAVSGIVAVAPHIFVEPISIESIEGTRRAYRETNLRERLARYHDDVDATFRAWNDIWLDPAFRSWNIEAELDAIACPVLAVQGREDEYGTMEQLHGIVRRVPGTRLVELADCRHSPHKDQREFLIEETVRYIEHRSGVGHPARTRGGTLEAFEAYRSPPGHYKEETP
jgi:pimeloyl-ACP methyl ester carboxylesterase